MNTKDRAESSPQQEDNNKALVTRAVSLQILQTVLDKKQPLDQAFDNSNGFLALEDARDRGFVKMLVTTTIRRLGQIDDLVRRSLTKQGQDISPPLLHHLLRLGTCQLVFMDVPNYAAVNTTVTLAEQSGLPRQKAFVNAVLRKIGREGKEWTTKQDIPRLNTPEWMLQHWINDYGIRTAVDIAQANMAEAPLDLTIKNKNDLEYWEKNLKAKRLPTDTIRLQSGGRIDQISGFSEGHWWVQDASAAIPARLFGDIKGKTVVDLCAAPGGKTAQLVGLGAHVIALDRSARRLVRFNENMERLGVKDYVSTEAADASVWTPQKPVDALLLDAPCTASGTLRKRPDVAWLKQPKDLDALKEQQRRLLENSSSMLKEGGMLIYCTCSLFKEEGEKQIDAFLNHHPEFERSPIQAEEIGGIKDVIDENGDLRILPFQMAAVGGMDGFYVARLIKK